MRPGPPRRSTEAVREHREGRTKKLDPETL
jgi:hypothetical protein